MKTACTLCGACGLLLLATAAFHFIALDRQVQAPDVMAFEPSLIPIVSEVQGRIRKSYIREGSTVHVGDPLIELDGEGLFHKKDAIESRIHFVEIGGTRAQGDLAKLYSELEEIQLELNSLSIISEAEGKIVVAAFLCRGEKLAAGSAVAVVRKQKRR
jgi:multidrug resistance efflux pump